MTALTGKLRQIAQYSGAQSPHCRQNRLKSPRQRLKSLARAQKSTGC